MSQTSDTKQADRFETMCGVTIAVFAAILAISDLGGNKFGDDEILAQNDKNGAYLWFHSKGIKETQVEGQKAVLETLLVGGVIAPDREDATRQLVDVLDHKLARYKQEKSEILRGSRAVGQDNWVQDVDGQMGKVVGAKELEQKAGKLATAGDMFDYANLFLQLCLVLGAISIVVQRQQLKRSFYGSMVTLGLIGACCAGVAYSLALRA